MKNQQIDLMFLIILLIILHMIDIISQLILILTNKKYSLNLFVAILKLRAKLILSKKKKK